MDEIADRYKGHPYVDLRYQRWISNNMQNTLWRIDGGDPIPEEFIVIKNDKPVEKRYFDAIIGEKAERIHKYSKDNNEHILKDIYTDSTRSFEVIDFLKKDFMYKPRFGEMAYELFEYDVLKGGVTKSVHPSVLTFENGAKYDVIQFASKELLLYIFPNVSLIGMYTAEELRDMNLVKVQMMDKEYFDYLKKYEENHKS
ncbi:MAG: hypothetical protein CMP59_08655 [Flavobacteriales bacterium]|nr:hypothetical protein [Flavobacteriales bacterium]|tara:strand:- start:106 stop:702 length:597 start_codon:yes stop_codon:yes gene_type:complete